MVHEFRGLGARCDHEGAACCPANGRIRSRHWPASDTQRSPALLAFWAKTKRPVTGWILRPAAPRAGPPRLLVRLHAKRSVQTEDVAVMDGAMLAARMCVGAIQIATPHFTRSLHRRIGEFGERTSRLQDRASSRNCRIAQMEGLLQGLGLNGGGRHIRGETVEIPAETASTD